MVQILDSQSHVSAAKVGNRPSLVPSEAVLSKPEGQTPHLPQVLWGLAASVGEAPVPRSPSAPSSGHAVAEINASLFGRQRTEWLLWVSCLPWPAGPALPQASSEAPRRPRRRAFKDRLGAVAL